MKTSPDQKRVVVVTGGGSGIGKAIAAAFAEHGDQVVIIGRTEDKLRSTAQAIGNGCTWQTADLSESKQVEAAVAAIAKKFDTVDVLVNNAGSSGFARGLNAATPLDIAETIWNDAIGVNLTGAFLMSFAIAPYLRRPGGRIINISSDAALTGGVGLRIAGYTAAKAGLLGLTRALAIEYGPEGITVNAIAPGFIAGTGANNQMSDEMIQGIAAQLPVRRAGNVADIASAALFLASAEAGFINGELLNINGGRVFGR